VKTKYQQRLQQGHQKKLKLEIGFFFKLEVRRDPNIRQSQESVKEKIVVLISTVLGTNFANIVKKLK
jgi:hypothetical protein